MDLNLKNFPEVGWCALKFAEVIKMAGWRRNEPVKILQGFRVHFDLRKDGLIASDKFPDSTEESLQDLDEARLWMLKFIESTDPEIYRNVRICDGNHRQVGEKFRPY